MQFTLRELLDKYKVVVPQIQRDYAQGRESELDLRKGFVGKIKQSLQKDASPLNLDFVYGYTEKAGDDVLAFVPLDGQQRLTTLWLIHWYLAPRVNKQHHQQEVNFLTTETQKYLKNFTYETRISTKRFCNSLIAQPLTIEEDIDLSHQIIDAPWFMPAWGNDPTIISMLNMLDTLQKEMVGKDGAWENLVNNRKITFDYIDIKSDEFKLTDELYIKMNSRGKPLTSFENFKAQFSGLLSSKNTDYLNLKLNYQNTQVTYQQYFAFKIDSVLMDLFWKYRTKVDSKIDDCFLKYIYYIAEFLYFRNKVNALSAEVKHDFEFLNKIFSIKNNIDFLFNSFDFLSDLTDIDEFFETLLKDLSTFDNYPKNYFLRAITDTGFDVKDKIIFYAVLAYGINNKINTPDDDIKDFIRIVRNLLLAVRQPNQSKRIEYTTNLRLPNVSDYCKFIDGFIKLCIADKSKTSYQILAENDFSGFTKENIANEKTKANLIITNLKLKQCFHALEELPQIQGNTVNFKLSSNDIVKKIDAFREIWSGKFSNSMIVRAYLTIDDYSVITHSYSSLGEIRYLGGKGNWNRILTATDKDERKKVSESLDTFLTSYINTKGNTAFEKLQYLIDNFKPYLIDWRYYFVKYEPITENHLLKLDLFTWQDSDGFDINHLGNSGSHPLHSYHLNPYLIVLKQRFTSNEKVKLCWGRFTDISFIEIDKMLNVKCVKGGWKLMPIENYTLANSLIIKYDLKQQNDNFLLSENDKKDRIEIAIELINDVLK